LGNVTPVDLVEYDPAGHEVARGTLPPTPVPEPFDAQALLGVLTPPVETALLTWATEHAITSARQNGGKEVQPLLLFLVLPGQYFNPFGAGMTAGASTILAYRCLILLSALVCSLSCFLQARRLAYSPATCLFWSLVGIFLGWVGLLLLLAIQECPARLACPKCSKLRVVTRDTCEHCGSLHAASTPDGTEIFEPTAAAPMSFLDAK
jgi:hypothetical protein